MSAFKSCLLALALGFVVSQTTMAQVDYIGYVYELPYYQPYQSYKANDGSQFMQNGYGDYYQYDNNDWGPLHASGTTTLSPAS